MSNSTLSTESDSVVGLRQPCSRSQSLDSGSHAVVEHVGGDGADGSDDHLRDHGRGPVLVLDEGVLPHEKEDDAEGSAGPGDESELGARALAGTA